MELDAYALMASHEADHWWFVGRRAVLGAVLDQIVLPAQARVLEAGCGTGGNLYLLQQRGHVSAFEPHAPAASIAQDRHPQVIVKDGQLPDRLPFREATFDLVAALDVLEHVEDDRGAIEALVRQAKPGGYVLVSVPTHPILWGAHDRRLHHKRRYGVKEFRRLIDLPGTRVEYIGAFNTFLAPIAVGLRLAERVIRVDLGNQERRPPWFVNSTLAGLFAFERHLVAHLSMPFGLSHAALLRRVI